MQATTDYRNGDYKLALSGKFTFSDTATFNETVKRIPEKELKNLMLDLKNVDFMDSAALGMLLLARNECEKYGKHISIRNISGQVKKIFELASFYELFDIS